jgi:hypothetical protein
MSARQPAAAGSKRSPIAAFADALPAWAPPLLSDGGRLLGALVAIWVAADQDYDRTVVVAIGVAVVALATLDVQWRIAANAGWLPAGARPWMAGFGAGAVFFAGALLAEVGAGAWLLPLGAAAGIGALLAGYRSGRDDALAVVVSFFAAAPALLGAIVLIALVVEG